MKRAPVTPNVTAKAGVCGVVPDKRSVSEASAPPTAALLHPRCPTQTGSTPRSGALGDGKSTWEGVRRLGEVVQDAAYLWRGPTTVGTTCSSWTFCLTELLRGKQKRSALIMNEFNGCTDNSSPSGSVTSSGQAEV